MSEWTTLRTGAANQFYDKFNIRYQIGEICEYLWKVEPHRRAWGQLALNDSPFYMRFLNMLINDAIWQGGGGVKVSSAHSHSLVCSCVRSRDLAPPAPASL